MDQTGELWNQLLDDVKQHAKFLRELKEAKEREKDGTDHGLEHAA